MTHRDKNFKFKTVFRAAFAGGVFLMLAGCAVQPVYETYPDYPGYYNYYGPVYAEPSVYIDSRTDYYRSGRWDGRRPAWHGRPGGPGGPSYYGGPGPRPGFHGGGPGGFGHGPGGPGRGPGGHHR